MRESPKPSLLDRLLRVFADVKAGEGFLSIVMAINIFLILNAYYVLKPIRGSLMGNTSISISDYVIGGDELKAYLAVVMSFFLIFVVHQYGVLTNRASRIRVLNITSAFIVVALLAFFVLLRFFKVGGAPVAIIYFIWLGTVNVFPIAQLWSYANDIYTRGQGKRLFPIIAVGMNTGAILGAYLSQDFGKKHTMLLMFSSAIVLGIVQILYNLIERRVVREGTGGVFEECEETVKDESRDTLSDEGGLALVFKSKYLLLIAAMILLSNIVNTTGEFIIDKTFRSEVAHYYPENMFSPEWVAQVASGEAALPEDMPQADVRAIQNPEEREEKLSEVRTGFGTSFYGSFYFWVNLVGAALQLFLVSRLFKFIGVRGAVFILPAIAMFGGLVFGILGTVLALRLYKTAENATDYSLQNTVKAALFLPTSRDEKYKAKAFIDMVVVRAGDALSAGIVAIGLHVFAFGTQQFAFFNVAIGVIWLYVCLRLFREHKKLVPTE
jgi:AAA family ATP:ADP antiporter